MTKKIKNVIINPPYAIEGVENDNNKKAWIEITSSIIEAMQTDGRIGAVTPEAWMSMAKRNKLSNTIKRYNLEYVDSTVKKHFPPGVGSTFTAWVLKKSNDYKSTRFNGEEINIFEKQYLLSNPLDNDILEKLTHGRKKFEVLKDTVTAHSQQKKKAPEVLSRYKTGTHIFPMFHTGGKNAQTLYCTQKCKGYDDKKVVFTLSGNLHAFYDDGNIGVTEVARYIPVENNTQGKILIDILLSDTYTYLTQIPKWCGYIDARVIETLPALDLRRTWTEEEIQNHFDLSEEDIKRIKSKPWKKTK